MKRLLVLASMLTIAACAGTARNANLGNGTDWATVRCEAQPDGSVKGCAVVAESRPGLGFGEAALRAVQRARPSNRTVDGMTAAATFTATIQFREDGTAAAPSH